MCGAKPILDCPYKRLAAHILNGCGAIRHDSKKVDCIIGVPCNTIHYVA